MNDPQFSILGPLEVRGVDGAFPRLPAGRARTVLALLCLHPGRAVSQDRLIDLAWNGAPPASATTRLHGFVSELRRALRTAGPEPVIRTVDRGYLLAVADDEIDLHLARARVATARAHRERGETAAAARCLEDALALWRGPAFDGIECAALQAEAEAIEREQVDGLEELADLELALGRHSSLVPRLGAWVARYPLRERLRVSFMRALAGSGRQAEAIETYHDLRRQLAEQLGVDPAPHVRELYGSILDGDRELMAPRPAAAARPLLAQLPPDTGDFAGRREQVRQLREALPGDAGRPAAAVVSVVSGPGGIGKSALAVHVAHLLAEAFPDGQLHVDLAGMSGSPLEPADVLARLLRDLGVGPHDVPTDEAERATRYRSLLTGRRILLVLDDARSAAQVRPLLPGAPGCAVLVTSRAALADLEGARRVDLDVMDADDGRELFTRIVGASRVAAEPEAADRLVQACVGLPLAIRIAGAKLASRPGWSIDAMASRLATERVRLAELKVGDLAVRASFQLSYDTVGEEPARMFRLLGLAGIPLFGAGQAGALCDIADDRAEQLLDCLADAHMLQSPAPGVYRFHDLLRLFAAELAGTHVSADEAGHDVGRLLLWYAHALRGAGRQLARGRSGPPEGEPLPGWTGAGLPDVTDHRDAMEWCEAEYPALEWAIEEAARRQRPDLAAAMASWMWLYATRAVTPASQINCQRIGLECARTLGVEPLQAWLLNGLGLVLARAGDHESAVEAYQESLDLRTRLDDLPGVAASRNNLGNVRHEQGRYADAVQHYLAAAELAETAGWQQHLATILVNVANTYREMGSRTEALAAYSRATDLHEANDDRYNVANCHSGIGETLLDLGRPDESLAHYELATAAYRALGTRDRHFLEALDGLGQAYTACGRHDEARRCWTEAIRLADESGSPLAATLRNRTPALRTHPA